MDERGPMANTDELPSNSLTEFDEAKYLPYLDEFDFDEMQKRKFLTIIWDIMRTWATMDLPMDSCGQIIEALFDQNATDSEDVE